jgi:hypothetical protein
MTETPVETMTDAAEAERERELARRNMTWGWALLGLFIVLFGGTVLIAYAYLWLS